MDLKHIRTFAAVAREGNLTRAAEHLHVTQPALSLQLKNFQESLDLTLFARTAQGLAPNADGRALLPSALRILDAMEDFQRAIGALRDTVQGELRYRHHPGPGVPAPGRHAAIPGGALSENPTHAAPWHVRGPSAGRCGRVIWTWVSIWGRQAQRAAPPCWKSCRWRRLPITWWRPRAGGAQVAGRGWQEIAALPWIWTPPDSVHHRLLAAKFDALGIAPNAVAEVDQEASMLDLVRSGVGLSLVRDSIALRESQANGLLLLPSLAIPAELSFITQAARQGDPLVGAALAAVRAAFG